MSTLVLALVPFLKWALKITAGATIGTAILSTLQSIMQ